MASLQTIICAECKRERLVHVPAGEPCPRICADCQTKIMLRQEDEHLKKLKEKTEAERLEILERKILRLEKKLADLSYLNTRNTTF
ncbi:MAG TPA: hypothetical protein VKO42_03720 [Patescibacteria group bacterium]|nr:hypothetical protein [Patescibacteria group bacterium]